MHFSIKFEWSCSTQSGRQVSVRALDSGAWQQRWRQRAEVNRPLRFICQHVNIMFTIIWSCFELYMVIIHKVNSPRLNESDRGRRTALCSWLCCKCHWLLIDYWLIEFRMAAGFAPPKLKDFILTERLGSGTYATVYKAFRKASDYWSLIIDE